LSARFRQKRRHSVIAELANIECALVKSKGENTNKKCGAHITVAITDKLCNEKLLLSKADYDTLLTCADICVPICETISNTDIIVNNDVSVLYNDLEMCGANFEILPDQPDTASIFEASIVNKYLRTVNTITDPVEAILPGLNFSSAINSARLKELQLADASLIRWRKSASKTNSGIFVNPTDGLMYRRAVIAGKDIDQLILPHSCRHQVISYAHSLGHMGQSKTRHRILLYFCWPGMKSDINDFIQKCNMCQKNRRATKRDKVPIAPVPREQAAFGPLTS